MSSGPRTPTRERAMGTMSTNLHGNELEQAIYAGIGEHEILGLVRRYANEQRWTGQGAYYAWGRMDGGEDPVVGLHDTDPNSADTAKVFSDLYVTMMTAFWERRRVSAIGLPSAWENFRLSGGTSLEYPRAEQPVDLHV